MRPSAAPPRRFASRWFKGEVSPSIQGQGLVMLVLNARVNPRYTQFWSKSESSLSLSMMQVWSLAMLTFDPRVRPCNAHPWYEGEPSLHSALTQECILTISAHDARSKFHYAPCWGFAISRLIGSTGMELKAKNISKKSLSCQKQFPYLSLLVF